MNQSVVCCLDILGYTKLVNKYHSNDEFIKLYELIFTKSLSIIDKLKSNSCSRDSNYNEKINKVLNDIRLITFSDTIIFILYIREDDNEHINDCLYTLLSIVSTFCTLFIGKFGNTLRGGMSIGQHYDNYDKYIEDKNTNLFMFSKSLIESHDLESRFSIYPRILVSEKLKNYIKKISFNRYDKFFYQDFFNETCFRMYSHYYSSKNTPTVIDELKTIKKLIQKSIDDNQGDIKILQKLNYFSNYHNYECKQLNINNDECYFNVTQP